MVSFQTPLSPNNPRETTQEYLENSSKKRKWEEEPQPQPHHDFFKKSSQKEDTTSSPSFPDIELHLETPLPLGWQRCLDIQSGKIHFYNTRTHKRTSKDPRITSDGHNHMSLDLELNLPCESSRENRIEIDFLKDGSSSGGYCSSETKSSSSSVKKNPEDGRECQPPWFGVAEKHQQAEDQMVATVCTRCYMLVMLCKSSPSCPNCKFMHPPDQSPPSLFKGRCSLLC